MSRMRLLAISACLLTAFFSTGAFAALLTGGFSSITQIRILATGTGGTAYITVSSSDFCSTNVFSVDLGATTNPNGRDVYAAALAAEMGGKQVAFDAVSCAGWGTPIVGIYVNP